MEFNEKARKGVWVWENSPQSYVLLLFQSNANDPTFVFRLVQEDKGDKLTCLVSRLCVRPALGTFPCGHCSKCNKS